MTPRFDLVELVTRTYQMIYLERVYLARLAAVPVLIIFMNFIIVTTVVPDVSLLRRGLFLIPAMMAEAWLVCQFLRTALTGERWPMRLPPNFSGTIPLPLFMRARGLLSAMIFYLLVTLIINALAGVMGTIIAPGAEVTATPEIAPENSILALALSTAVVVALFNFRLLWLYIPLVINMPIRRFLAATGGFYINFHLIGLWLATSLPLMAAGMVFLQPLLTLSHGDGPLAFIFFLAFAALNAVLQTLLSLVTSCAIAAAVSPLIFSNPPKS